MLLFLQILFTVLSALCIGAIVPLGIWQGWLWAGGAFLGAILFYVLMLLCKQSRILRGETTEEEKQNTENANDSEENQ